MHQHLQNCNGVTEFKQVENKVFSVFAKRIRRRCDESCMGTEIRLLFGRHVFRFANGDDEG